MTSDEWYTPPWVFDPLSKIFGFDLDVCATAESAKCQRYFEPILRDGLSNEWDGPWLCNPPYSNIAPWVKRALNSAADGHPGVMLLPAWTDRAWWHAFVEPRRDRDVADFDIRIESVFTRRIQFGYPGNPTADPSKFKTDGITGPRIYPVFLSFIPPDRRDLDGLIRRFEPDWPRSS